MASRASMSILGDRIFARRKVDRALRRAMLVAPRAHYFSIEQGTARSTQ